VRIVGADGEAALTAREADLRGPVAIVVGSEGKGLGPAVRRRCDLLVRIPMHGRIDSLNAAVAGSILLYEAAAQRGIGSAPTEPTAEQAKQAEPPELPAEPAPEPNAEAADEPDVEPVAEAAEPQQEAITEPADDPPETPDDASDLLPEV
jgi:hypothetical protein